VSSNPPTVISKRSSRMDMRVLLFQPSASGGSRIFLSAVTLVKADAILSLIFDMILRNEANFQRRKTSISLFNLKTKVSGLTAEVAKTNPIEPNLNFCLLASALKRTNKPNFPFCKIAITPLFLMPSAYCLTPGAAQNKPNSNPKAKPIRSQNEPNTNPIETQPKPISNQQNFCNDRGLSRFQTLMTNSFFRLVIWALSRATIEECICETRDSDKSRVVPISFIVISS